MLVSALGPLLRILLTVNAPEFNDGTFVQVTEPHGSCAQCVPIVVNHDITFHLYTKVNKSKPHILELKNDHSVATSYFNSKHNTVIIIHGFGGSQSDSFPQIVSDAYLERGDYNIIRVDWQKLSAGPFEFYPHAVKNVPVVGNHVAQFILWLHNKHILVASELHVIGFSLGAHVAGFVGKALAPLKVARITGLDPAGPSFNVEDKSERLDKSDATFVDIIHTNTEAAGLLSPIGHADFYPNQGTWQPGCVHEHAHLGCSHRRAWKYYAESILNPHGFPAFKCATILPIIDNCTKTPEAYMGFVTDPNTNGTFLVHTNSERPFAKSFDVDSNGNDLINRVGKLLMRTLFS